MWGTNELLCVKMLHKLLKKKSGETIDQGVRGPFLSELSFCLSFLSTCYLSPPPHLSPSLGVTPPGLSLSPNWNLQAGVPVSLHSTSQHPAQRLCPLESFLLSSTEWGGCEAAPQIHVAGRCPSEVRGGASPGCSSSRYESDRLPSRKCGLSRPAGVACGETREAEFGESGRNTPGPPRKK